MSKKFLWGIIAVLLVANIATLTFWQRDKQHDESVNKNETVASIGDDTISFNEWMLALRKNYGKKQLRNMLNHQVVEEQAEANNVTVNQKVIDREIANLTTMQGVMTEKEASDKAEEWEKEIRYRYQLEALLTSEVSIPENQVRSYYEDHQKQYDFHASTQVSHIVVPDMAKADKVITELDNGASFNLLAQEYSIDEETKGDGGYLGFWVNTSQFWPDGYLDKSATMEAYTYSDPFWTDAGVAIIYLHRELSSVTFNYDEIKPYVKQELAMDQLDKPLEAESLWDELNIDWKYGEN